MVHEAFLVFWIQAVNNLRFAHWCQSQNRQGLGLPASKETRAMHARQVIHFRIQRTDFINLTAVRTDLIFGNQTAHFRVLHLLQDFSHITHDTVEFFVVCVFLFINRCDLVFDSLSCGFTRQLFFYLNSLLQVTVVGCDNLCLQLFINMQQFYFCFFLADCCDNFFLEGNQFFDRFMPFEKSFQHDIFRQLLGSRFYHVDSLFGTSHCQFQKRNFFLFLARVDDKFTIYIADLNSCDRAVKRNI